ncbi:hypothetical protein [Acidipropionibacterium timonense]|uniref:hypothetical protein n=1 Tax=Acidipropionibacterium timonense TaxID=2161818 RepID=UPI00103270C4|nr:hypothetical protein [Acidipropionibacterium timonense]
MNALLISTEAGMLIAILVSLVVVVLFAALVAWFVVLILRRSRTRIAIVNETHPPRADEGR